MKREKSVTNLVIDGSDDCVPLLTKGWFVGGSAIISDIRPGLCCLHCVHGSSRQFYFFERKRSTFLLICNIIEDNFGKKKSAKIKNMVAWRKKVGRLACCTQ